MNLTPITVIVENKSFTTTKDVLLSSEFFRGMMETSPDETTLKVPRRSKKLFKYVLCYLVDTQYPYPKKYKYELSFYGIDYDEKNLYNPYSDVLSKLDNITDKQTKMSIELDKIKDKQTKMSIEVDEIKKKFNETFKTQMNLISITFEDGVVKASKDSLLLSGFFRGMMDIEPENTNFVIDYRSKKTFKHVIAYLRDNRYPFPRKYKSELDFYDIEYDEKALYDPDSNILMELDEIKDKQKNMSTKLDKIKKKQN